jgi:EAL domain-containing protein (putative c-di-GMP-specific phosphodiesterase class I)
MFPPAANPMQRPLPGVQLADADDAAEAAGFDRIHDSLRRERGQWSAEVGILRLRSAFQPIYSLAHGRAVGHEALLRAEDGAGRPVPAPVALRGNGSFAHLLLADRSARLIHALNFAESAPAGAHWLFLNLQPEILVSIPILRHSGFQERLRQCAGLAGHQIVLEVIEDAVPEGADFEGGLAGARSDGCLIALDDFGAGQSNFDRVWRLRPAIVKLDRSVVRRGALDAQARRVVAHMVALLHHCGALVLMEGVETREEALLAFEANADLVQGDLFAAPAAHLADPDTATHTLCDLWDDYETRSSTELRSHRSGMRRYIDAIGYASALLSEGRPLEESADAFLRLPAAEVCYLLDGEARQIGDNAWAPSRLESEPLAFAPMRQTEGAHWGRRPYFRRAMENVGLVQVTRPYRTVHGAHLCVTVSVAFRGRPGAPLRVVCGDIGSEGGPG